MKAWESQNGSLDGFDPLKVDIISVHEHAARGVSQAESKYHEMSVSCYMYVWNALTVVVGV
jgi:hypothetical protein